MGCTLAYLSRDLDPKFGEAKQLGKLSPRIPKCTRCPDKKNGVFLTTNVIVSIIENVQVSVCTMSRLREVQWSLSLNSLN
jgi:hypothetical protein